jgi:hypothetical protein
MLSESHELLRAADSIARGFADELQASSADA